MPLTEQERRELAEELSNALAGFTTPHDPADDFSESEERWVAAFREAHS
jgi:hypothetical protein